MSEPQWTVETRDLVVSAITEPFTAGESRAAAGSTSGHVLAGRVLAALADAGLLVAPAAEVEQLYEWASRHQGGRASDQPLLMETGVNDDLARHRVASWRHRFPDVESHLVRRRVVVTRHDWEEASDA